MANSEVGYHGGIGHLPQMPGLWMDNQKCGTIGRLDIYFEYQIFGCEKEMIIIKSLLPESDGFQTQVFLSVKGRSSNDDGSQRGRGAAKEGDVVDLTC